MNQKILKIFDNKKLKDYGNVKKGISTSDNNRFIRLWFELNNKDISYNVNKCNLHTKKWIPLNKGGAFRKWFGNNNYVINWENNGEEIKNFPLACIRNEKYYFQESITWTDLTSGLPSFRYNPCGFIHDVAGPCVFSLKNDFFYYLSLLNSKITSEILEITAPTMHFNIGNISEIPIIYSKEMYSTICSIGKLNIYISKLDWDSFENSWDFIKHPLIKNISTLQKSFDEWKKECNDRFSKLKYNEEKLNTIFIDIYKLQSELASEVKDEDITIRKADLNRDIKSFISYAVGCMLGRYSLDV